MNDRPEQRCKNSIALKTHILFILYCLNIIRKLLSLNVQTIFFFPFYHTGGAERVHLDIVKERLFREFDMDVIITSPQVTYKIKRQ